MDLGPNSPRAPPQPQLDVTIGYQMAGSLGIDMSDVLSEGWAGFSVNDFDKTVPSSRSISRPTRPFRTLPSDIDR